jgi:hypothetical protein
MPALTDAATGTGPASGTLQGRNPREIGRWRCRDRYGYVGTWSAAGEVVKVGAWLVLASDSVATGRDGAISSGCVRRDNCVGGEPAMGLRGRPVAGSTRHRFAVLE